jgi:alkaline phosphatase D
MSTLSRRHFLQLATAIGASAAWTNATPIHSLLTAAERRDLYPEGVASADPQFDSILLWTRHTPLDAPATLTAEISEDEAFTKVVATTKSPISAASDWTTRVLAGNLKPAHIYYYRFTDAQGFTSRTGRTITAPAPDDPRPTNFAFISCQNANDGAQNAYRRMIFEDEKAPDPKKLGFVLHLGDFIYELVWYPEDRPQGMYDRKIRDIVRYANGEKIDDFHIPTTVDDYRSIYKAYLHDPDLQDARAHFPFVNMWDNHEFSWKGWQGLQNFDGKNRPAQTRKVAALQAFFEYQPARMAQPNAPSQSPDAFHPPKVADTPITKFDNHGLGEEPNNLAAIHSLKGYRTLRYGRHIDLIITDQRSYRSEEPTDRPEAEPFTTKDFPELFPQEAQEILDAGRAYNNGNPPETIRFGEKEIPNFRKDDPPQTILGAEQKAWFLNELKSSRATWKIWGNTTGTLDFRADPQNLPPGTIAKPWPGAAYAGFGGGDHGSAYIERAEIYDFIRTHQITNFATVAGDRHSFWAGYAAKSLPPQAFEPVGIAFVTGSISAPGIVEALEHKFPKDHPLRALYLGQSPTDTKPQPTINLLLRHGVRSCLEYAKTGDIAKARAATNPNLSPHLTFVDMGGHGYAVVRASAENFETEFVCIPRPIECSKTADGGPLTYRVLNTTSTWRKNETPKLITRVLEGDPRLSI